MKYEDISAYIPTLLPQYWILSLLPGYFSYQWVNLPPTTQLTSRMLPTRRSLSLWRPIRNSTAAWAHSSTKKSKIILREVAWTRHEFTQLMKKKITCFGACVPSLPPSMPKARVFSYIKQAVAAACKEVDKVMRNHQPSSLQKWLLGWNMCIISVFINTSGITFGPISRQCTICLRRWGSWWTWSPSSPRSDCPPTRAAVGWTSCSSPLAPLWLAARSACAAAAAYQLGISIGLLDNMNPYLNWVFPTLRAMCSTNDVS